MLQASAGAWDNIGTNSDIELFGIVVANSAAATDAGKARIVVDYSTKQNLTA